MRRRALGDDVVACCLVVLQGFAHQKYGVGSVFLNFESNTRAQETGCDAHEYERQEGEVS